MNIPLVQRAESAAERIALRDAAGRHAYAVLLRASAAVAQNLLGRAGDLEEARVALHAAPGLAHVAAVWGIWRAGGVAVPLAPAHPPAEWEHVLADSGASGLVTAGEPPGPLAALAARRGIPCHDVGEALGRAAPARLPAVSPGRRATLLYTSGSTGRPKGVVSTHAMIAAQISTLVSSWEWSPDDRIPLFLPLNHVHGSINVLGCALWSGASCDILPGFDAAGLWRRLIDVEFTLLMAVPTIYARLLEVWEQAPDAERKAMTAACRRLRLMVSGSAALPVGLLERWRRISGHTLLERYGMTETGMVLSNPLRGDRRPGYVGLPLPGVDVQVVDERGHRVAPGTPGELEVRGTGVFTEYWCRPDETRDAFRDGWFRTGDRAVLDQGAYRILGRMSVDFIKTGGYKVSALEIEQVLAEAPGVAECAVIGIHDPVWGERVAAVVVPRPGAEVKADALRAWAVLRLAGYKVPTRFAVVGELPRNAMGKVVKPGLASLFGP